MLKILEKNLADLASILLFNYQNKFFLYLVSHLSINLKLPILEKVS